MTKQQEVLKRMNILIDQLAQSIESGEIEMGWVRKSTDEIDTLIDEIGKEKE